MKQKNSAGDYTNVKEIAFLPTSGIPSKLDRAKHVLIYLWTELGSSVYKLGEVTTSGHDCSPREAFENRYKDKSGMLQKKQVLGLFVIPKDKEDRGYDNRLRQYINCHSGKVGIKFFCPGDDGFGNGERIENFNIDSDFSKLVEIIENFCGISASLMTEFEYRTKTQESLLQQLMRNLEEKGRCLFNAHTAFGKSTCSPHIVVRLLKNGEIALFTTPIKDTLDDLLIKVLTMAYGKKIKAIQDKDISGKSESEILDMIEQLKKDNIILFCLSVQNVRFNDTGGEEAELRKKFSFLKKLNIRLWIRDEYHTQYNGLKTAKILAEIEADMILDLTASIYRLLDLYNDYTADQIIRADNLWAIREKKINKNPDYKNYPDVSISCVSFEEALSPDVKKVFSNVEEEYRAEKMFEVQNGQFVQISSIIETFKFVSDEQINGITKKNKHCALSDTSLTLKTFGLVRIPQGSAEFPAKEKCALLANELNKVITRTLYKTADDFILGKKLCGTTSLLNAWSKEASSKGRSTVCIITHEQLVVGSDIPPLSYAYLFDRITSIDVFVQFLGRLQRVFEGKDTSKCYVMCPGMHVQISSMMYNAVKDFSPNDEKMQKLMYDNISLVYHLDGEPKKISFDNAIKNNDIVLKRSIENAADFTHQIFSKFDGIDEYLDAMELDKSLKDNFGKGKDVFTSNTQGQTFIAQDDDAGDDNDPNKGSNAIKKHIDPKKATLSVMYRTVPALYVVENRQTLAEIWDTDLASLWFTDQQLNLAKKILEFEPIRPTLIQWFEEKVKSII